MQAMGIGGQGSAGASGKGGNTAEGGKGAAGQAKGGKGDGKGGNKGGGGDFFGTIKSGIHENLMALGSENLKKLGTQILQAGVAKVTSAIKNALTPKVKFKLGNEEHELWVEKGEKKNVVMMASTNPEPLKNKINKGEEKGNVEIHNKQKKLENEKDVKILERENEGLAGVIQKQDTGQATTSEGDDKETDISGEIGNATKNNYRKLFL